VHFKRGLDHLVYCREVQPGLEETGRVGGVCVPRDGSKRRAETGKLWAGAKRQQRRDDNKPPLVKGYSSSSNLTLVDKGEHLAVDNTQACRHPLEVTVTVPSTVALAVSVVNQTLNRCSDHLEAPVRMLRETGDTVTVVHTIGGRRIEIGSVPYPWGLHLGVPCWVGILMIDTEEEWAESGKGRDLKLRRRGKGDEGGRERIVLQELIPPTRRLYNFLMFRRYNAT